METLVRIIAIASALTTVLPFLLSTQTSLHRHVPGFDVLGSSSANVETERCSVPNDISGTLSSLFGSAQARDNFFLRDKGARVVHLKRVLAQLRSPLEGIQMQDLYETNEWINLRKRGSIELLDKNKMTEYADFQAYIQEGGSAVVSIVDTDDFFLPLKQQLEASLGEISMNVYHSGPNAVALNRHCDSYDVLVLQLENNKEWEVCSVENVRDGWTNITMVPGDLLYIPKGVWHAATTASGFRTTTHLTIGLLD